MQREVRRRDQAEREVPRHVAGHAHPVPERGARRRLAHLVGTDHQHDVEQPAGDAEHRVAHRVVAGGAGVLDAGHRDVEQAAGVGEDAGREPVGGRELAEPGGLDVGAVEALVDTRHRLGDGHRDQVLDAEVEVLGEGGHPGADDGHPPHRVTPAAAAERVAVVGNAGSHCDAAEDHRSRIADADRTRGHAGDWRADARRCRRARRSRWCRASRGRARDVHRGDRVNVTVAGRATSSASPSAPHSRHR